MLSYIANLLSKLHSIYNLSIVLERGGKWRKKREKTVQEKNCSIKERQARSYSQRNIN